MTIIFPIPTFLDTCKLAALPKNISLHFHSSPLCPVERCLDLKPYLKGTISRLYERLIQFKVLHCLHYSNDRLANIYLNVDPKCLRCHQSPATAFSHMCNATVSPNPFTAIFGLLPLDQNATMHQVNAIAFASLLARHLVLFHWKSAKLPSFMQWVKEGMSSLPLEKVRYIVHGSRQKFDLTWSPLIEYVESLSFT
ncbi:unnamed protein product [Coregonus sp. 'balchen']|nr:unnamed protein product [Coregonus sp. 'balchen']